MSEVQLTTETIRRFRQNYIQSFGAATRDDRLYETVSEGRRYAGLEHWMPLFYDGLDTLFDYLPANAVVASPVNAVRRVMIIDCPESWMSSLRRTDGPRESASR